MRPRPEFPAGATQSSAELERQAKEQTDIAQRRLAEEQQQTDLLREIASKRDTAVPPIESAGAGQRTPSSREDGPFSDLLEQLQGMRQRVTTLQDRLGQQQPEDLAEAVQQSATEVVDELRPLGVIQRLLETISVGLGGGALLTALRGGGGGGGGRPILAPPGGPPLLPPPRGSGGGGGRGPLGFSRFPVLTAAAAASGLYGAGKGAGLLFGGELTAGDVARTAGIGAGAFVGGTLGELLGTLLLPGAGTLAGGALGALVGAIGGGRLAGGTADRLTGTLEKVAARLDQFTAANVAASADLFGTQRRADRLLQLNQRNIAIANRDIVERNIAGQTGLAIARQELAAEQARAQDPVVTAFREAQTQFIELQTEWVRKATPAVSEFLKNMPYFRRLLEQAEQRRRMIELRAAAPLFEFIDVFFDPGRFLDGQRERENKGRGKP